MLTITSHVPAIAAASRRALRAAAATIELSGGRLEDCSIGTGGLPPTCIYHSSGRLLVIPTCADRPLLLAEAEELVRSAQEDALIVRLSTWPEARHLVTFDVLTRRHWEMEVTTGCRPCLLPGDPRLWLISPGDDRPRLCLGSEGLRTCSAALPDGDSIEIGLARATQFYRQRLWGGL
jgi:hypothetical protein